MSQTKIQDFQIVHDAALPVLGRPTRTEVKSIVDGVDANFEIPLRLSAAATPDAKLYIKGNRTLDSDGGGRTVAPIKGAMPTIPDSTVNFQTRATTGATFSIAWPSSTSGYFRRFGFILLSTGVIQVVFGAQVSTLSALLAQDPGAMFSDLDGWYLGYVDLEATTTAIAGLSQFKTAGSLTSVIENSVGGTSRIYRMLSAYEMGMNVKRSVVDFKGDLLVASAADTVTRLPSGVNNDLLISDSSTATGLRWTTTVPDSQITHDVAMLPIGSAAGASVNSIINSFATNTNLPMRMYASSTPDSFLNFSASTIVQADGGSITVPPINNSIPSVAAATLDLQTQATTGTTFSINWPATTVNGNYYRIGFTLLANGTIQGIFSPTNSATYPGTLTDPGALFVPGSLPVGYIDLRATSAAGAFKTALSSSDVVENSGLYRFGSGGGTGSGSDSGAAKSPADGFKALVFDTFSTSASDSNSKVDGTFTTASHDLINQLYQVKCDKTKTITTTGTSFTISGTPVGFALTPGDIIWSNAQSVFRKVDTVLTVTTGTLDTAFPVDLAASAGMISQAVWTKELINYGNASELTRLRDYYPSTNISTIHLEYNDSLAVADPYADATQVARIVASASNDGVYTDTTIPLSSTFSSIFTRPTAPDQILDYPLVANTNRQRLSLCFFANPNNASVVTQANVLDYDVSLYSKTTLNNGGYLNSAFCMSDGTGTPSNCSAPVVVSGKTRVTLGFNFVPDLNTGKPSGDLLVAVEGQLIPRYYPGVTGGYYIEVSGTTNTIEFWSDLSVVSYSIHVERRQGSIDTADANRVRLLALYDAVVGSAADVTAGRATHSSLQAAHNNVTAGSKILFLQATVTESVTISKQITVEGKGRSSVIVGNLTLASGSSYSLLRGLKVDGNITINSVVAASFVKETWISSSGILTNSGIANSITVIQE